jgi:hypothetical protein
LPRAQDRRRNLIQEGLEQVVILPIDQDDLGIGLSERLGGSQAAEATPHDHHAGR